MSKTVEELSSYSEDALVDLIENFLRKFNKEVVVYDTDENIKRREKLHLYLREIAAFSVIKRVNKSTIIITDKKIEELTTSYLNISYPDIAYYTSMINPEEGRAIEKFIEDDIDGFLRCAGKAVSKVLEELDYDYYEQVKNRITVGLNNYETHYEITELGTKNVNKIGHTELIPISIDGILNESIIQKCYVCGEGHFNFVDPNYRIKKCKEIGCQDPDIVSENKEESRKIDYITFTGQQRNERAFQSNSQDIECKIVGYEKCQMFINSVKQGDVLSLDFILRSDYSLDKRRIKAQRYLEVISFDKQKEDNLFKKEPEIEILVKQKPADPMNFYWKCVDSIAPHLYGEVHRPIKQAILSLIMGNKARRDFNNTRYRGDFMVLLVASPASGKTEYGKYVVSVVPKSHYASSLSSKSGFTVGAYISENNRRLVFGVIPLSNDSVVVIDEVDKLSEDEYFAMIECMDDNQILYYNKAGFSKQIFTRCGHLHLCNASKNSGEYNPYEPFYEQVKLPSALLSRYDLIFVIHSLPGEDNEKLLEHFMNIDATMVGEEEYEKSKLKTEFKQSIPKELDVFDKRFIIHLRDYLRSIPYNKRPKLISGSTPWIRANEWIIMHKNVKHLKFLEDPEAANNPNVVDLRKRRTIQNLSEHIALIMRDSNKVEMHHMEIALNLLEASIATLIPRPKDEVGDLEKTGMKLSKDYSWFEKLPDHYKKKFEDEIRLSISKHAEFIKACHKISFQKCQLCKGRGYVGELNADNIFENERTCEDCKGERGFYIEFSYNDLKSLVVDLQQTNPKIYPAEFDVLLKTFTETEEMKLLRVTRASGRSVYYKPTEYLLGVSVVERLRMMLDPLKILRYKSREKTLSKDEYPEPSINIKARTKSGDKNAYGVDRWLQDHGYDVRNVSTDKSLGDIVSDRGVPIKEKKATGIEEYQTFAEDNI